MKVGCLQTDIVFLDPERNRRNAEEMLRSYQSTETFPELVVLPELLTSGYFFHDTSECRSVAEAIPGGATTEWLVRLSSEMNAYFVAGLAEREGGALYNSAVVTGPDGYVGKYRKVHLYYEEKTHFEAGGEAFPVFELATQDGETVRLGVMICFDWYYPEAARSLALQGAEVIAHPSNLVRPDCPRAMPIRALENHLYTITSNRIGKERKGNEELEFIGQSRICDPAGKVLATADRRESTLIVAEINPKRARDKRITAHNDLLADRKPASYGV